MGFNILTAVIFGSISLMSYDGEAALCSGGNSTVTKHPCQSPWLAFRGHCYLWFNQKMPWLDAERHCQNLSHLGKMAHLTSIHSKEEDEFIKRYVMKASGSQDIPGCWIGFNDCEREGTFQWTDGSDVSYKGWSQFPDTQPDDWMGNEDCVERFIHIKWNDGNCETPHRFVCKM